MSAQRIRARRDPAILKALRSHSASFYAVIGLIAAVLGAVIYTFIVAHSPKTLQSQIVHEYFDSPPSAVTIDWQLYKAPLAKAECDFQAIGQYEQVIGQATEIVGPSQSKRTTNHSVIVHFKGGPAVSALISGCRILRSQ